MSGIQSKAIREFIAKYIYGQHFAEGDGIPPKRLIELLRDKFCSHGVRNAGREKKEMADVVRSMVSQRILERIERPDVGRAYLKLHPDFNVRALVGLPESRESSVEVEPTEEAVSAMTVEKRNMEEGLSMVEKTDADIHAEAYAEMIRGAVPMIPQPISVKLPEPHYPTLPAKTSQGETNRDGPGHEEAIAEKTSPEDAQEEADQREIYRIEALAEETRIQEILAEEMRQEEMQEAETQQDHGRSGEMGQDLPQEDIERVEILDEEMMNADSQEPQPEGSLSEVMNFDKLSQGPRLEGEKPETTVETTMKRATSVVQPNSTQQEVVPQSETNEESIQPEETSAIEKPSTDERPAELRPVQAEVPRPEVPQEVTREDISSEQGQLNSEPNDRPLEVVQVEGIGQDGPIPRQILQATPEVHVNRPEHPSGEVGSPEGVQLEQVPQPKNSSALEVQREYAPEPQTTQLEQLCNQLREPEKKTREIQHENDITSALEAQRKHSSSSIQDIQQMQPERPCGELKAPEQIQLEEIGQEIGIVSTPETHLEQIASTSPEAEHMQPKQSHLQLDDNPEVTRSNPKAEIIRIVKKIVPDIQQDERESMPERQQNSCACATTFGATPPLGIEWEGLVAPVSGTRRDSVSAQPETSKGNSLHDDSSSRDGVDSNHEVSRENLVPRPRHASEITSPAAESAHSSGVNSLPQGLAQGPNFTLEEDMLEFRKFLVYKRQIAQGLDPGEPMHGVQTKNRSSAPATEEYIQNPGSELPSGGRSQPTSKLIPGAGKHAPEPESEAHAEIGPTVEVDVDTRMADDIDLDSSQPILTPSRKRRRVMEIAPSEASDSHDPISPVHSSRSTPHRPSKRVCTPSSDARRQSTISRMSPMGSRSPFVMPDRPNDRPPLPFKNERKPDHSAPALKHAVQTLREKFPEDDFETDNGKIMCLDCERDFTPQQYPSGAYNVNGFKTHLNGKGHKDLRNKRGEKASRVGSYTPTSYAPNPNAGNINAAFDSSIQPKAIDKLVEKEDRLVASLEDQLHKARQHVASVKLLRDHNLMSQFTLLEASAQERFSKIDSLQEATRRGLRELENEISSAFTSFEEKNQNQMSELGERVSSAESSFTEAQESIRGVKKHVNDVEGKTSTELKEMFDRIARSEVRNNERIEKQGLDHEKLSRQLGKVEQKWRSRINDTIARMEDLEKMVETRESSIQELKAQNDSLSRQLQQQRWDMQAFQKLTEDQMAAYAAKVATIESRMNSKMGNYVQQANDHVDVFEGQMAARARETSQHKEQTDLNIAEMKREFTSRLEMMQEKFLERVKDLEKKHYGQIKKLEGKVLKQQGYIDRCNTVVPTLFQEGQELRGFCEEFRESLVDLSGQITTVSMAHEKKGHKSRNHLGVLEQHNGNSQKEEQRSRRTSAAP